MKIAYALTFIIFTWFNAFAQKEWHKISKALLKSELNTFINQNAKESNKHIQNYTVFVVSFQSDSCFTISNILNEISLESIDCHYYLPYDGQIVIVHIDDKYKRLIKKLGLKILEEEQLKKVKNKLSPKNEDPFNHNPSSVSNCLRNRKMVRAHYKNFTEEPRNKSIYIKQPILQR